MIELLAYAIGIMYTPGPVNLIGLNAGLGGRTRASLGFFLGVGLAMFVLLLLFGWAGTRLVREDTLIYVSLVGCLYIAYLAIKIASDSGELGANEAPARPLGVRSGFVIQLLNPKAMLTTLPITSIQFPAAQIHGWSLCPGPCCSACWPPVPPAATRWRAVSSDVIFNILAGSGTSTC